jgi:hypothetical protein
MNVLEEGLLPKNSKWEGLAGRFSNGLARETNWAGIDMGKA